MSLITEKVDALAKAVVNMQTLNQNMQGDVAGVNAAVRRTQEDLDLFLDSKTGFEQDLADTNARVDDLSEQVFEINGFVDAKEELTLAINGALARIEATEGDDASMDGRIVAAVGRLDGIDTLIGEHEELLTELGEIINTMAENTASAAMALEQDQSAVSLRIDAVEGGISQIDERLDAFDTTKASASDMAAVQQEASETTVATAANALRLDILASQPAGTKQTFIRNTSGTLGIVEYRNAENVVVMSKNYAYTATTVTETVFKDGTLIKTTTINKLTKEVEVF